MEPLSDEDKIKTILFNDLMQGLSNVEAQKIIHSIVMEQTNKSFDLLEEDRKSQMIEAYDEAFKQNEESKIIV